MAKWKELSKAKGMEKTRKNKCPFTLLELMVGIAILLLASGVIGLKMHGAVQRKRFHSEVERLKSRLLVCQKLAVAMQADWKGELKKRGKEWLFEAACEEGPGKKFPPLTLHVDLLVDGRRSDAIPLYFFSSGQISPHGTLLFQYKEERIEWKLDELFQRSEGTQSGPAHPAEN